MPMDGFYTYCRKNLPPFIEEYFTKKKAYNVLKFNIFIGAFVGLGLIFYFLGLIFFSIFALIFLVFLNTKLREESWIGPFRENIYAQSLKFIDESLTFTEYNMSVETAVNKAGISQAKDLKESSSFISGTIPSAHILFDIFQTNVMRVHNLNAFKNTAKLFLIAGGCSISMGFYRLLHGGGSFIYAFAFALLLFGVSAMVLIGLRQLKKKNQVFEGILAVASFNKNLAADIKIYSKDFTLNPHIAIMMSIHGSYALKTDIPEFDNEFLIFSKQHVEAKNFLTPSVTEVLIRYKKHFDTPVIFSFFGSNLYVAFADLKLTGESAPEDFFDATTKLYAYIASFYAFFWELNERISNK